MNTVEAYIPAYLMLLRMAQSRRTAACWGGSDPVKTPVIQWWGIQPVDSLDLWADSITPLEVAEGLDKVGRSVVRPSSRSSSSNPLVAALL